MPDMRVINIAPFEKVLESRIGLCMNNSDILAALAKCPVVDIPAEPVIPIASVSAYLQRKLDDWEALGERKWDPMNAWGYNFIRACQDDLDAYKEALGK